MASSTTRKRTLLIFLHGSGSSGSEIRSYLEGVPLDEFAHRTFRQVCDISGITLSLPTATKRPYTPCLGERLNVWFDRTSSFLERGLDDSEDVSGVAMSVQQVLTVLREAISSGDGHGHQYEYVYIGGFSMGGCLSLHLLLQALPPCVKGVFSMGSFLVRQSQVP